MIRFSFSSLCMSVMFALFMILSLYILFHYKKAMEKLGFPLLNAILWLTIFYCPNCRQRQFLPLYRLYTLKTGFLFGRS